MYDIRDNKPYTVRKLADGNCWMTEDLKLELTAGTPVEGSLNTSATAYTFTPTSCSTNGACSLNNNTKTPAPNGKYYYSWYAATAETGTSSLMNIDTTASICPVGWRIPANYTFDNAKSYGALTNAYGLTTNGTNNSQDHVSELESAPLNFARSGNYDSGNLSYDDLYARYWSSTAYVDTSAFAYYFRYYNSSAYPSDTSPQNDANKSGGMAVRCVAL